MSSGLHDLRPAETRHQFRVLWRRCWRLFQHMANAASLHLRRERQRDLDLRQSCKMSLRYCRALLCLGDAKTIVQVAANAATPSILPADAGMKPDASR